MFFCCFQKYLKWNQIKCELKLILIMLRNEEHTPIYDDKKLGNYANATPYVCRMFCVCVCEFFVYFVCLC